MCIICDDKLGVITLTHQKNLSTEMIMHWVLDGWKF